MYQIFIIQIQYICFRNTNYGLKILKLPERSNIFIENIQNENYLLGEFKL